ncbi:MAG: NCS1 family nucleobase:cation symporter-1 [Gemmatimonadaceae bacterium]|nr:NCS1 family nucleobase:cation symporter-1 [Gemmatimonadaceae bacterium]
MNTEQFRNPSLTYEIGRGGAYDPGLYNADLAPVPQNERTWRWHHFAALWVGMAITIPTYTLASSLIDGGWSWQAAVGSIVLGNFIVLLPIALNAEAGTRYGIPFPVLARASFGVMGANIPALLRAIVACGWFGIQTWIGGFAIFKMLEALWPGIASLPPVLPASIGLGTGELICFTIFWLMQVAIVLRGMESIKFLETWGSPFLLIIGVALLAWAWVQAGGWGPMLTNPAPTVERSGPALGILGAGLTSAVAFWGTMALSIPDFSRYARSQRDQVIGQAVGLPATMALFAFIGAAVTNATVVIFGTRISDPIALLARIGGPAMVIVSMIGLTVATLTTNIAANVVSPANAFSNMSPSKISFRKGALITAGIGVLMFPWKLYNDASAYIFTWLIGYGALLGPVAGIMIADYFLIRKRVLRPDALFLRDRQYEYKGGFNPVAMAALILGVLPNFPGFLGVIGAIDAPAWAERIYDWAWFVGFLTAGLVHLIGMRTLYPDHRVVGPPALADTLVFSSRTGQAISTKTGEEQIP